MLDSRYVLGSQDLSAKYGDSDKEWSKEPHDNFSFSLGPAEEDIVLATETRTGIRNKYKYATDINQVE